MAIAGWYPDPGGEPGKFRWWDGQTWTPTLTTNPASPPPGTSELPMQAAHPGQAYGAYQSGYQPTYSTTLETPRRSRTWITVLVAGLLFLALVVGAIWVINRATGGILGGDPAPANPATDVCPKPSVVESPAPPPVPPPGRVQGGQLSYPERSAPWGAVTPETRVPFGRDVFGQSVMLHDNYNSLGHDWVASVLVGELVAGDGFFSPEQGAEIVSRCVLGLFYADSEVGRTDVVNRATTVDGYDAWEVEMHLDIDVPDLDETGETAIILIVATSLESSSIYYASIPDSRPDLLDEARRIQGELRVEE